MYAVSPGCIYCLLVRTEKLRESDKFAGDQQRLHPNTGDIVGAEMAGVSSQQQDEDDGDDSDSDLERGPRRDELEDEEGGVSDILSLTDSLLLQVHSIICARC